MERLEIGKRKGREKTKKLLKEIDAKVNIIKIKNIGEDREKEREIMIT